MKLLALLVGISAALLIGCSEPSGKDAFSQIKARGVLRVLASPTPETTELTRGVSAADAELSMLAAFADLHGLNLMVIHSDNFDALPLDLESGKGDLIADNLTITADRAQRFLFSEPFVENQELLVTNRQLRKIPESPRLIIQRGTTYELRIAELMKRFPKLQLTLSELDDESILSEVGANLYDLAVVDESVLDNYSLYRNDVKPIMTFSEKRPVGWAMPRDSSALKTQLDSFIQANGKLFANKNHTEDLSGIKTRKFIRVLTRDNPVNYYIHRNEKYGFEYELAKLFAESQGLKLIMVVPPSHSKLYSYLRDGLGDIIASSVTDMPSRHTADLAFSDSYLKFHENFVGSTKAKTPFSANATVTVRDNSSYLETAKKFRDKSGFLLQTVPDNVETIEILDKISHGKLEWTVIDEPFYYNALRNGVKDLKLSSLEQSKKPERSYVWVVRASNPQLFLAINSFFAKEKNSGELNKISERYFGKMAEKTAEQESVSPNGISPYDAMVKEVVTPKSFDWRFISAQICQESRFDSQVTAHDGGMGLLQLMPVTAKEMKCPDPYNPEYNVRAGSGYLAKQRDRLHQDIEGENRLCFALASYNGGYGHVLDARRLAAELGYDPNVWFDNVELAMKLLKQREYYSKARYGSCQSDIITRYVRQIFSRYSIYQQSIGL